MDPPIYEDGEGQSLEEFVTNNSGPSVSNGDVNDLSEELRRELEEPMSGDWVSPGKPEDQALPSTSPLIPPNASPAVAPNTPNAPTAEEGASSFTQVN